jgi:hypothetical protein
MLNVCNMRQDNTAVAAIQYWHGNLKAVPKFRFAATFVTAEVEMVDLSPFAVCSPIA